LQDGCLILEATNFGQKWMVLFILPRKIVHASVDQTLIEEICDDIGWM